MKIHLALLIHRFGQMKCLAVKELSKIYTVKRFAEQLDFFITKLISLDFRYENHSNDETNHLVFRLISLLLIQVYSFGSKKF